MTTPAWTRAERFSASTSSTRRMRAVLTTTPPSTGVAPPERPVPAPRPTTGTPALCSARITAAVSSVLARQHHQLGPHLQHGQPVGLVGQEARWSSAITPRAAADLDQLAYQGAGEGIGA